MEDGFGDKVGTAARAAWWTLFIGAAFVTVQWLAYLAIMSARPGWVLSLWGADATWDTVRPPWFEAVLTAKLTLWPLALAAIWLTLWARRLRSR